MSLVSILTPTVPERERFFERCCKSVQAQTYKRAEHIVSYLANVGPMPAFQDCLDGAQGEFVMALADDDWLAPHAVETLVPFLEDADVVFCKTLIVSPGNDRLVAGHACMWRKALTDEIGGYDLRYKHSGDSELYARMIEHGAKLAYCPEPLYFFTEHESHNGYVHREELKLELDEIKARYEEAHIKLATLVPPE